MIRGFSALALALCSMTALPDSARSSSERWMEVCKDEDSWAYVSCLDQVRVAAETLAYGTGLYKGDDRWCPPDEVKFTQVAKIVKKWLENHPERLHQTLAGAVDLALTDAFPCR